jgi:hypothetical protein
MTISTETSFDFDFKYTPSTPATRDYPGDGPEVEILTVRLNGVIIPIKAITAEQYEEMVQHVHEHYY